MMALLPTLRPDGTLLYLPPGMAARLGVAAGSRLTEAQLDDSEMQALLASRVACNEANGHCNVAWHRENGYL